MSLLDVSLSDLLVAFVVTFVGALVQGSVGFGMAVIAAPVLLMVNPQFVPGSLITAALVLCLMIARRDHQSIARDEVVVSSLGRLVTTIPTAMVVGMIHQETFNILFSIAVLVAVGISFSGFHLAFNRFNLAVTSGVSGVTGTLSSIGGPPMALVYQHHEGRHIRGTLSIIFAIGAVISITCLACVHAYSWRDAALGLLLLPGIFAGFALSRYTTPWLDARATRPAVLGVAALSAALILVRTLWSYT